MHVRRADGTLVEGAAAFVEMWARVPALAWLARLCRLPGMPPVVEAAYRVFLAVRPLWRRTAPAESAAGGSAKP
jgi:predicted DCC family thiol-disulfide oxidoreductase YuxK